MAFSRDDSREGLDGRKPRDARNLAKDEFSIVERGLSRADEERGTPCVIR